MGLDKFLEIIFGALLADRASKLLLRIINIYILVVILIILVPNSISFYQNDVVRVVIGGTQIIGIYVLTFTLVVFIGRFVLSNLIVSLTNRENSTKKSLRQLESLTSSFVTWWVLFAMPGIAIPLSVIGLIILLLISILRDEFLASEKDSSKSSDSQSSTLPFDQV